MTSYSSSCLNHHQYLKQEYIASVPWTLKHCFHLISKRQYALVVLLLLSSLLMVENPRSPYLNISSIEHALPFLYHPDPGLNACMFIFILVVNNLLENSIWEFSKPL